MNGWMQHLAILPIAMPLVAGAITIPMDDQRGRLRAALGVASALAMVVIAAMLGGGVL